MGTGDLRSPQSASILPTKRSILGPLNLRFLLPVSTQAGTVAVFEVVIPAGQRLMAPAHSHDHYEETVYGIDGVLTWTVDGKLIDVGPGQALCIPRGAVHRFDNNGAEDVKGLCVVTPAAIGPQFFREAAELVRAAGGGPPDRAKMVEIMRRHDLTPVRRPIKHRDCDASRPWIASTEPEVLFCITGTIERR